MSSVPKRAVRFEAHVWCIAVSHLCSSPLQCAVEMGVRRRAVEQLLLEDEHLLLERSDSFQRVRMARSDGRGLGGCCRCCRLSLCRRCCRCCVISREFLSNFLCDLVALRVGPFGHALFVEDSLLSEELVGGLVVVGLVRCLFIAQERWRCCVEARHPTTL